VGFFSLSVNVSDTDVSLKPSDALTEGLTAFGGLEPLLADRDDAPYPVAAFVH
jgi:hypothetical protein